MKRIFIILAAAVCCIEGWAKESQRPTSYKQFDGIDVSHHQGRIDWKKVAENKNIQFVYIKATEGSTNTDSQYEYNLRNARKQGLKVGAYHYLTTHSAVSLQFQHFKEIATKEQQDLIPMLDVEIDPTKSKWTTKQMQDSIQLFCDLCKAHYGKFPMIYGTQRSYNTWCAPYFNHLPLYIGRYGKNKPQIFVLQNGKKVLQTDKETIWQFSESGTIKGISKPVDLCRFAKGKKIEDISL